MNDLSLVVHPLTAPAVIVPLTNTPSNDSRVATYNRKKAILKQNTNVFYSLEIMS